MNTITNGNLGINRVPVSRMLKAEVAEYASKAIAIAKKHVTEESLIIPLLKKLEDTEPQIEMLGVRYGIDPLREVIDNLMSEMMLTVSDLKLKVRIRGKRNDDAELRLVNSNIDNYFGKLRKSKNDKEIHQKITGFVNEIEENEELAQALVTHQLTQNVNSIRLAKADVDNAWNKRVKLLSERPKMKTKEIVDKVFTAITNLFTTIELAHSINPEEDNTALALELSQLSDMYNRSINIRVSNNKRKFDREKERQEGTNENEGAENEGAENEGAQPMATAMYAGNDWNDDWTNDWHDDDEEEQFANPFETDESSAEELNSNSEDVDDEEGVVALE